MRPNSPTHVPDLSLTRAGLGVSGTAALGLLAVLATACHSACGTTSAERATGSVVVLASPKTAGNPARATPGIVTVSEGFYELRDSAGVVGAEVENPYDGMGLVRLVSAPGGVVYGVWGDHDEEGWHVHLMDRTGEVRSLGAIPGFSCRREADYLATDVGLTEDGSLCIATRSVLQADILQTWMVAPSGVAASSLEIPDGVSCTWSGPHPVVQQPVACSPMRHWQVRPRAVPSGVTVDQLACDVIGPTGKRTPLARNPSQPLARSCALELVGTTASGRYLITRSWGWEEPDARVDRIDVIDLETAERWRHPDAVYAARTQVVRVAPAGDALVFPGNKWNTTVLVSWVDGEPHVLDLIDAAAFVLP